MIYLMKEARIKTATRAICITLWLCICAGTLAGESKYKPAMRRVVIHGSHVYGLHQKPGDMICPLIRVEGKASTTVTRYTSVDIYVPSVPTPRRHLYWNIQSEHIGTFSHTTIQFQNLYCGYVSIPMAIALQSNVSDGDTRVIPPSDSFKYIPDIDAVDRSIHRGWHGDDIDWDVLFMSDRDVNTYIRIGEKLQLWADRNMHHLNRYAALDRAVPAQTTTLVGEYTAPFTGPFRVLLGPKNGECIIANDGKWYLRTEKSLEYGGAVQGWRTPRDDELPFFIDVWYSKTRTAMIYERIGDRLAPARVTTNASMQFPLATETELLDANGKAAALVLLKELHAAEKKPRE